MLGKPKFRPGNGDMERTAENEPLFRNVFFGNVEPGNFFLTKYCTRRWKMILFYSPGSSIPTPGATCRGVSPTIKEVP